MLLLSHQDTQQIRKAKPTRHVTSTSIKTVLDTRTGLAITQLTIPQPERSFSTARPNAWANKTAPMNNIPFFSASQGATVESDVHLTISLAKACKRRSRDDEAFPSTFLELQAIGIGLRNTKAISIISMVIRYIYRGFRIFSFVLLLYKL